MTPEPEGVTPEPDFWHPSASLPEPKECSKDTGGTGWTGSTGISWANCKPKKKYHYYIKTDGKWKCVLYFTLKCIDVKQNHKSIFVLCIHSPEIIGFC